MASAGKVLAAASTSRNVLAFHQFLTEYQRFYMQNEAMNQCFHSSIKDLTNMTVIIGKFNGFKTENFWSGIVDLCSKIDWLRGVGRSDEKNNIRFRSGLDHFNMECFFSSIPSNLWS